MTRQTHRLIKDILLITIVLMIIVIVANSQSHGQQAHLRDSGVLLWGGTQGVSSGTVQSFIDLAGSLTNNFEIVATGTAASTLTASVVGCMPGGTCSTAITSSTGVASQLMTPASSSGPFQTYKVTLSWTGGDATTAFRINRIGVMAKLGGSGSGSGTVSPNNGTAGAMATYAANAGSITVSADQNLIDAANTLTYSASGGFSTKLLTMPGATSGTATITPPAVAGTITNPFLLSNTLRIASSGTSAANAALQIGAANIGLYDSGSAIGLTYGGTLVAFYSASGLAINTSLQGSLQHVLLSSTAPTISSGFGSSPSIAANNGTGSFTINVGTGGVATTGVIGLPTATAGWNCTCTDITTNSATVFACKQTGAGTTTTAPIGEFTAAGAAQAWTASDVLNVSCHAF